MMVDFKLTLASLLLLGFVSAQGNLRQKRQTWGNVPTFHLSDGVPVKQSKKANPPAHDPPPPPPPNPPGTGGSLFGGVNPFDFGMGMGNTGSSGGNRGNAADTSQNRWDHHLPQNMWHPPPPPPPQQNQRPPPPQNHWNHPPPPPNHWNHPPPPHNWAPPPPPPPPQQNTAQTSVSGSAMAGALASLQQQMQMSMLTAGIDTPDHRKHFNPAPIEILQYTCPVELPVKQCVINPCPTRCKRYPLAKCYTNPCGNCSPEWIQNGMKIIDCD